MDRVVARTVSGLPLLRIYWYADAFDRMLDHLLDVGKKVGHAWKGVRPEKPADSATYGDF